MTVIPLGGTMQFALSIETSFLAVVVALTMTQVTQIASGRRIQQMCIVIIMILIQPAPASGKFRC